MVERYERIFTLPGNLYTAGTPVIIAAGALLRDTENGKILAQLKFKSISPVPIKVVKVHVTPLDTVGKPLGEEVMYEYLDLNAARDKEFGQKKAILITNPSTRSFTAEVTEVAFEDNSLWTTDGKQWAPLPESVPIENALGDREMAKQYRLRYGQNARYQPAKADGIWLCTCGVINAENEEKCHACGSEAAALCCCDLEELKAEAAKRVEQETAVEKEQAQKRKKFAAILVSVSIVCIAAILLITKVFIPGSKYKQATALLEAGQYDEAIAAFKAMDGYRDSAEQVEAANLAKIEAKNAAKYEDAVHLLESGHYDGAIKYFSELGDYRDSEERCEAAKQAKIEAEIAAEYEKAAQFEKSGDYYTAYKLFTELEDYKDASTHMQGLKAQHPIACAEIGDIIVFGSYEQDNDRENGQEPIEWYVVAATDDEVSLFSKYCLDAQAFNVVDNAPKDDPWENTSLYQWLNEVFCDAAFGESETTALAGAVSLMSPDLARNLPEDAKPLLVSEYALQQKADIDFVWLATQAYKSSAASAYGGWKPRQGSSGSSAYGNGGNSSVSSIKAGAISYTNGFSVQEKNYASVSDTGGIRVLINVSRNN